MERINIEIRDISTLYFIARLNRTNVVFSGDENFNKSDKSCNSNRIDSNRQDY